MRLLPLRLALAAACLGLTLSPALARDNKDATDRARNTRIAEALKISKTRIIRRAQLEHLQLHTASSASSRSQESLRKIANRSVKKPASRRK